MGKVGWQRRERQVDEGDQAHAGICKCGSAISFRHAPTLTVFGTPATPSVVLFTSSSSRSCSFSIDGTA